MSGPLLRWAAQTRGGRDESLDPWALRDRVGPPAFDRLLDELGEHVVLPWLVGSEFGRLPKALLDVGGA